MIEQEEYGERFIVFIDILGFREHINKTVQDSEYFIKLKDTLNFIADLKKENDAEKERMGKEITVFSDSIVISYPVEQKGSAFFLILDVVHIQLDMMQKGILMRGGLTVGKLCHNDNIVYGPAMIKAYELETNVAIYPRVVVSQNILEIAAINASPQHTPKEELQWVMSMLDIDRDGQFYVDFLSQGQEANDHATYIDALYNIRKLIVDELSDDPRPPVRMKYEWLKSRFNTIVENVLKETDLIIE
ncbi:hypothetical protein [Exiguobacterium artemiae]|uniref:hypothetical protein n=1 Tax=Exiguobacterium artemiae TaxID=340145 RepID=UPI00047B8FC4|nr:hypothetical protein [Exiguobacterium sibiricum]